MNEKEDYFRVSKNGHVHTLSDRIPLKWKELMIWTSASFLFLIIWTGWLTALFIATLTSIGYVLYRFAAWIYYTEVKIDEKNRKVTRLKKILNRTQKSELITEKFDPSQFEYTELTRSGKTKFLLSYQTHKVNELLILKSIADKRLMEQYIAEKIK